ncbi:MAG: cytochrome c-type biogenesis protein [Methylomonas sp.]|jgi:cytochrome c-type biogenesis protein CcmH
MKTKLILAAALLLFSGSAAAVVEFHEFKQPEQEQIYQNLIKELRCLVCQNQTIADSNADLAKDLRRQVHEMVEQGQSKQQIADFMTARYGDFVLYRPDFNLKTALLWLGPLLFLLAGLLTVILFIKRRALKPDAVVLSEAEQKRLRALLEKGDEL